MIGCGSEMSEIVELPVDSGVHVLNLIELLQQVETRNAP